MNAVIKQKVIRHFNSKIIHFAWSCYIINLLLIFLLYSLLQIQSIIVLVLLALTLIFESIWLIILYRDFFSHWSGWISTILMIISSLRILLKIKGHEPIPKLGDIEIKIGAPVLK